ncbi:MAG: hypothetical protein HPY71_14110 [Firmicutes bacterium]|nr:hypothetical protein [Bacillota bacterium]
MLKVLAVIPARGGSKSIPRKNMRLLAGKPLIYYILTTALRSKLITDVVVTSDDDDILRYASQFGVITRKRPAYLAEDTVTLDPVVNDALDFANALGGTEYDLVVTLQPTSPLLRSETLDCAIETLIQQNLDTIISVVDDTHLMWKKMGDQVVPDYDQRLNRQWLPKKYRETGAFVVTRSMFVTAESRLGNRISVYCVSEDERVDIDSPTDWLVCESLLRTLTIAIVVNGNSTIGLGHIYRAITVADAFLGHRVRFYTYESEEAAIHLVRQHGYDIEEVDSENLINRIKYFHPDIVINDILDTSPIYIRQLKNIGTFVVNFEDLGDGAADANLIFNDLYELADPPPTHRFGHKYFCLSSHFMIEPPSVFRVPARRLLITFGGIDQNNLTLRVVSIVPRILRDTSIEKVVVVVGPAFGARARLREMIDELHPDVKQRIEVFESVGNMAALMRNADIAVTSNGRTVYELAAVGVPTVSIAQNDRETLHLFARYHRGVRYLGVACTVTTGDILRSVLEICSDDSLRKKMYDAQIGVDLKSGLRRVIYEIVQEYWRWKDARNSNREKEDHQG